MKPQLARTSPSTEPPPGAPPKLALGDRLAAAALVASNLLIFGWGAARLGFYYDDGGWMTSLPSASLRDLWTLTRNYVPGRNLHVLLQYAIYKLAGDPAAHLARLHLIQSAIDGLVVAAFFLLLRRLLVSAPAALLAAGLFSFWPIHGETHFWLPATPQNQLTTLFVIVFCWTSLEMVRSQRGFSARPWWFALLDAGVFFLALFTYDQVLFVLAALVAGRVATAIFLRWSDRWRFASIHIFYLAAVVFYAWVKLRIVPGKAPSLTPHTWPLLQANVLATIASTFRRPWYLHVAPLWRTATFTDWMLAALAAAALVALAIVIRPRVPAPRPPVVVFLLALLFYIAAYLPIWLWYISPRHHYFPSLGLFAGGAVCLAWLLKCIRLRLIQFLVVLPLGAATCFFAAADRGESRIWETSFTAKKQLFAEIKPDLEGKSVLALDEFPLSLESAYLILPHDALFGPTLFYGRSFSLPHGFAGDVSSAPAPASIFLNTLTRLYGATGFRYYPTGNFLVVRFTGWESGRFCYEKNPPLPLPYQIVSSTVTPQPGSFALHRVAARREGGDTIVSVDLNAGLDPNTCLTATLSFLHGGDFRPWGPVEPERGLNLQPVLLSVPSLDAANAPRAGRWRSMLRLYAFPRAPRLRLDFFAAGPDRSPQPLGHAEVAVEP